MRLLLILSLLLSLSNCNMFKAERDPVSGKKIRKEPDLMKRSDIYADEQGGIFNSKKREAYSPEIPPKPRKWWYLVSKLRLERLINLSVRA